MWRITVPMHRLCSRISRLVLLDLHTLALRRKYGTHFIFIVVLYPRNQGLHYSENVGTQVLAGNIRVTTSVSQSRVFGYWWYLSDPPRDTRQEPSTSLKTYDVFISMLLNDQADSAHQPLTVVRTQAELLYMFPSLIVLLVPTLVLVRQPSSKEIRESGLRPGEFIESSSTRFFTSLRLR